jgi:AcrR family transcriptional regulator
MSSETIDIRPRSERTRERILDAAMPLFVERGYRGTTIGDIETAAGLIPRAGTLYQHFKSKEDLLRACVERHVVELGRVQDAIELLPLGDLRAELLLMGRWNLEDLSRRQSMYRFLWKEGDRFPELRDRIGEALVERPLRRVADWIRARAAQAGAEEPDCEALALVMVQSMASYRSLQTIFGSKPLGVDEWRFLETWVEVCLSAAEHFGIDLRAAVTSG